MGLHSVQTIGILCADSSDLFSPRQCIISSRSFSPTATNPFLCCTGYNLDIKKNYLNLILSKKVDGIILVGSNFIGTNEEENQYIKDVSAQVPIMLLNASFDYPNVYSTLCDDYTSMFEATGSMLDAGIEDILYLYNSNSYSGVKSWAVFAQPWRHTPSRIMRNGFSSTRETRSRWTTSPIIWNVFPKEAEFSRRDRIGRSACHRRHEIRQTSGTLRTGRFVGNWI